MCCHQDDKVVIVVFISLLTRYRGALHCIPKTHHCITLIDVSPTKTEKTAVIQIEKSHFPFFSKAHQRRRAKYALQTCPQVPPSWITMVPLTLLRSGAGEGGKGSNSSWLSFGICTDRDFKRRYPEGTTVQIHLFGARAAPPFAHVPRCLFRLLERGDGLHSDVQSPEYLFSWHIWARRVSAGNEACGPARTPVCSPCLPHTPSNSPHALRPHDLQRSMR